MLRGFFPPWKSLSRRELQAHVGCPAGLEEAQGVRSSSEPSRTCPRQPESWVGSSWDRSLSQTKERSMEDPFGSFWACFSFCCLLCLPLVLWRAGGPWLAPGAEGLAQGSKVALAPEILQLSCLELSLGKSWELAILPHISAGAEPPWEPGFPT